jgi:predicted permease
MIQDLRFGLRALVKSPTFAAVAILSLALGIGANTAMFSVVHAVLLRPLPYADPDRLVAVADVPAAAPAMLGALSPAGFLDLRVRARSFSEIGAYIQGYAQASNLTGAKEPERITVSHATGGFFAMLGVTPLYGTELRAGEVRADRTVVLTHRFWLRKFAGDPRVIGSRIALNEQLTTIIGVLPAGFRFGRDVDVWRQFTADAGAPRDRSRWWSVVARLAPGVSLSSAQAEIATLPPQEAGRKLRVLALHEQVTGNAAPPLAILYAAVCLVLLIACANVAGLLLARFAGRHREIAVRLAIGASRARLARQMLIEGLCLAVPAACVGLLVAAWLIRALAALSPGDVPRLEDAGVHAPIVLFTTGVSLGCAMLFSLAPMLHVGRVRPASSLRAGRGVTAAAERLRVVLIVGEMALAFVLLVGAGLLLRTYQRLASVDPGFSARGVASVDVALQAPRYFDDWRQVLSFYEQAVDAVAAMPGVRAAAVTNLTPFDEGRYDDTIAANRSAAAERAQYRFVSPNYFRTLSVPIQVGRDFSPDDRAGASRVAILGASTARRLFGDRDPIGQSVVLRRNTRHTVVGIVGDTHLFGFREAAPLQVYVPFAQSDLVFWTGLQFLVRADGDPLAIAGAVRQRLLAIDPAIPPYNVRTVQSLMGRSLAPARMYAVVLTAFAVVALVLACAGLYALIACFVTQRMPEFGIRLALGADGAQLRRLVLRDAARVVAPALAIGGMIALVAARVMTGLLFGVTPADWRTFAGMAVILSAVALSASYAPARRAMRVDPLTVLRTE